MTIAFRPLCNPSPLGFPGGVRPGLDPSHPAAIGVSPHAGISAVACGKNFVSSAGIYGAVTGSVASATDGYLGPIAQIPASGLISFGGFATTATQCTIGAIFESTGTGNANIFSSGVPNGSGVSIYCGGSAPSLTIGDTFNFPAGTVTTGVPYFYAVSVFNNGGNNYIWNSVLVNLVTGQVSSGSGTATTTVFAPNGTFTIGTDAFTAAINVGAVMYGSVGLPLAGLLAWGAAPWGLWYPLRDSILVGSSAAAAFKAAWARGSNLPVIGTGLN